MEVDNSLALEIDLQTETTPRIDTDVCNPLEKIAIKQELGIHTIDDSENLKYAADVESTVGVKKEEIGNTHYQHIGIQHNHGACSKNNDVPAGILHDTHVALVKSESKDEPLQTTERTKFVIEIDTCKDEYCETHGYPNNHANVDLGECGFEQESGGDHVTKRDMYMEHSLPQLGQGELHSSVDTKPCAVVLSDIRYTYPDILTHGYGHVHDREPTVQFHTQSTSYVNALQPPTETPYKCSHCGLEFVQKVSLKRHILIHTGEKSHKCYVCDVSFRVKSGLLIHMRTHTGEKPHTCGICEVGFTVKGDLTRHTRTHTGEKPYRCSVCEVVFAQKHYLKAHMMTHTGEKPHNCTVCDVRFSRKAHLIGHMRTHTGEKPYKCSVCGVGYVHRWYLKIHMRIHTGEKPHTCSVCEVSFTQKGTLTSHMRTHTGEKPHKCSVCGVGYAERWNLKIHMMTHTGETPHKCYVCEVTFARKSSLISHMRTHTGEKPCKCSVCGVAYAQAKSLKRHALTHT